MGTSDTGLPARRARQRLDAAGEMGAEIFLRDVGIDKRAPHPELVEGRGAIIGKNMKHGPILRQAQDEAVGY